MSLFAGAVYSSPGVVQGGIGGGAAPGIYSTINVSTLMVAQHMTISPGAGHGCYAGNILTSSLIAGHASQKGTFAFSDISGLFLIGAFNGTGPGLPEPISMLNIELSRVSSIQTGALQNLSSVQGQAGDTMRFNPECALTNVTNLNISTINASGPITTFSQLQEANESVTGFSTFSTLAFILPNLQPSTMYNVSYTGLISTINVPGVTSNDSLFFACKGGGATQYSSDSLINVTNMCAGRASTFTIADTFTCYPEADSTIRLFYGATTAANVANVFTIDYALVLATNLGIRPV